VVWSEQLWQLCSSRCSRQVCTAFVASLWRHGFTKQRPQLHAVGRVGMAGCLCSSHGYWHAAVLSAIFVAVVSLSCMSSNVLCGAAAVPSAQRPCYPQAAVTGTPFSAEAVVSVRGRVYCIARVLRSVGQLHAVGSLSSVAVAAASGLTASLQQAFSAACPSLGWFCSDQRPAVSC
jgi:hypothetical protein